MKLRTTMAVLCLAVSALMLEACSRPQSPQDSCSFVQNPDQQRVSWKNHLPIKLYLHKSVPTEAYESIDRAVAEFNGKVGGGREIFKVIARGADGELNPHKDGYTTIYWFNSWDPNRTSEQARTTIYWSGVEIFEADMRINAANFTYNYATTSLSFTGVDLDSLVLHELGHVLGLAHSTASGSAMNATLDEGISRRKLLDSDLSNLKCEY